MVMPLFKLLGSSAAAAIGRSPFLSFELIGISGSLLVLSFVHQPLLYDTDKASYNRVHTRVDQQTRVKSPDEPDTNSRCGTALTYR